MGTPAGSEKDNAKKQTAEKECPLESLIHRGLECDLCTYWTVVGPVQMIKPECPVVELVKRNALNN